MVVRSFVTFDTSPARTQVEEADERGVARALMEHFVQRLANHGLTTTAVAEHDSYGWYSEVAVEPGTIWIMLQKSDHWLVITRPIVPAWKRLFSDVPEREHRHICDLIHRVLLEQGFRNIRWYTEDEFAAHKPGHAQPY